jgi:UDP-N-acetylglucosamine acyltransferase
MTVRIHPTALIAKGAEIAADVAIGPFVVVEDNVRIGPGCTLGSFVHLCGPLQLGERNQIFTGVVLGERPQHARYNDEPTSLVIGDDNIFGEQVTVNRGTAHSWVTRIGNRNHFMANSHIGHDCQVGDRCILAGGALVGGHCVLEDNSQLSANAGLHQFVRIGRLALLEAASLMTKDLPPFALAQGINTVCGINDGSMREAGLREADIEAVRRAFHILYQEHNLLTFALEKIDRDLADNLLVCELTHFIRTSKRGIVFGKGHIRQK